MRWILPVCISLVLCGCIVHQQNPAATQPATFADLATTQPSYWFAKPAVSSVTAADFDRLWAAAEQVSRDYQFRLDRQDYRAGVLTTFPLISAQWFEPWRQDVYNRHDWAESSIATIRRTIEFDFSRNPDGTFSAAPKVLVERETISEIRITAVTNYHNVFNNAAKPKEQPNGTIESDQGLNIPARYWYAEGRDQQFEIALGEAVKAELKKP